MSFTISGRCGEAPALGLPVWACDTEVVMALISRLATIILQLHSRLRPALSSASPAVLSDALRPGNVKQPADTIALAAMPARCVSPRLLNTTGL